VIPLMIKTTPNSHENSNVATNGAAIAIPPKIIRNNPKATGNPHGYRLGFSYIPCWAA
jgi:hypothetical protein